MRIVAFAIALFSSSIGLAGTSLDMPACHKSDSIDTSKVNVVTIMEGHKNIRPENVLMLITYTDDQCRFLGSANEKSDLLDFFWSKKSDKPDRCYERLGGILRYSINTQFEVATVAPQELVIQADFKKYLNIDFDTQLKITLEKKDAGCVAEASFVQNTAQNSETIYFKRLDATLEKNFLGMPVFKALKINGYKKDETMAHPFTISIPARD